MLCGRAMSYPKNTIYTDRKADPREKNL